MTIEFATSTFDHLDNSSIAAVLEGFGKPSYAWRVTTGAESREKAILEILYTLARKVSGSIYVHFSIQDGFVFTGIRNDDELSRIKKLVAEFAAK